MSRQDFESPRPRTVSLTPLSGRRALQEAHAASCPGCELRDSFNGAIASDAADDLICAAVGDCRTALQATAAWLVLEDAGQTPQVLTESGRLPDDRAAEFVARHGRGIRLTDVDPGRETPSPHRALPIENERGHPLGTLLIDGPEITAVQAPAATAIIRAGMRAYEQRLLAETLTSLATDFVVTMARTVESRDEYTGQHVIRVTAYAMLLAEQAGLSPAALERMRMGGLLHDIGKVAIPDAVLNKPGQLTDDEFDLIKSHAAVGDEILAGIPNLAYARPMVRWHHERFDGRGYPDGLAGHDIPLEARIMCIADSYDAMTSDRPYRPGMPHDQAVVEIERCAGAQFDPDLSPLFVANSAQALREAAERTDAWFRRDGVRSNHAPMLMAAMSEPRPQRLSA